MKISHYSFGLVTVDNIEYTSDILIFDSYIKKNWWRREGHSLHPDDLNELIKNQTKTLILGTGMSGCLKVPSSTREWAKVKGVEIIDMPTEEAVKLFNKSFAQKKGEVAGGFHLTC